MTKDINGAYVINFNAKRKLLLFIINISFIGLGVFFLVRSINFKPFWVIKSAWVLGAVGIICTTYFGLGFASYLKVFFRKVALVIDDKGILDHSTFTGVGRIFWNQISEIRQFDAGPMHYILIFVTNPQTFISRNRNFFERWHLRNNYSRYKTPIAIPMTWLHFYVDDLESLLLRQFQHFKDEGQNLPSAI